VRRSGQPFDGQVVRYDVGNVYSPLYAMFCRIAKKWIAT
jgi:hypothetical protein